MKNNYTFKQVLPTFVDPKLKSGKYDFLCWDSKHNYAGILYGEGIDLKNKKLNMNKINFISVQNNPAFEEGPHNNWNPIPKKLIPKIRVEIINQLASDLGFIITSNLIK